MAPMTRMATMSGKREQVLACIGLFEEAAGRTVIGTGCDTSEPVLRGAGLAEPCSQQARDKELPRLHSGFAHAAACSAGCHSKKPAQSLFNAQASQGGAYFCFQSEIERTANKR